MKVNRYFKTSSEGLHKKSLDAINVFNKTIDSLRKINEDSLVKKKEINEKITLMQQESDSLNALSLNNEKIIAKIEKIIN